MKKARSTALAILLLGVLMFTAPATVMGQESETGREVPAISLLDSEREIEEHLRGNLSYVQSRELVECIDIMGQRSSGYCIDVVLGEMPSTPPNLYQNYQNVGSF